MSLKALKNDDKTSGKAISIASIFNPSPGETTTTTTTTTQANTIFPNKYQ